jgi:hypothetical protein
VMGDNSLVADPVVMVFHVVVRGGGHRVPRFDPAACRLNRWVGL